MHPRRLLVLGLVILLAVVLGVLVRREVTLREARAPELPTETTQPQLTVPPAPQALKAPEPAPAEPAGTATRPSFDVVRVEPGGEAIIAGRAAPGTSVELLANGSIIDRTTANESGEFVLMPPPLEPGSHEFTLKTAGSASRQAVSVLVPQQGKGDVLVVVGEPGKPSQVVQAGPPDGPVGALPNAPGQIANPAQPAPQLRIGAVEAEGGRLFVQGSGPPGSKAVIYLNDAPLAEAQIGADGRWSLTVEKGLAQGDYNIRIDQIGEDGKVVARAEVPFTADDPAAARVASNPAAPATEAPKDRQTAATAKPAVSSTADGPAAAKVGSNSAAPATDAPGDRQTAAANHAGPITADDAAAAKVGSSSAAPAMEARKERQTAAIANPAVPITADTPAAAKVSSNPAAPAAEALQDQPTAATANPVVQQLGTLQVKRGDNLWRISRRAYGAGVRYSTIYQANADQIRDPNRIYPGQIFVMPRG